MRYSGIQPQYFPRLHYFARILQSDMFVIRDDCQYVRKHRYPDGKIGKSYQAHTPIKQASGMHYLHVPVTHDGQKPIKDTRISDHNNWIEDHVQTLRISYARAPFYATVGKEIEAVLRLRHIALGDLNIATVLWGILKVMGKEHITSEQLTVAYVNQELEQQRMFRLRHIRLGSSFPVLGRTEMNPNEKILALLKEVGADEDYCGGTAVSAYMDEELFAKNGIAITVQNWACNPYPQLHGREGFVPNLSILDLLMNLPASEATKVLLR